MMGTINGKNFSDSYPLEVSEIFFEPITEPFNIAPFCCGVSSGSNVDTNQIIDDYLLRFEGAWEELSKK